MIRPLIIETTTYQYSENNSLAIFVLRVTMRDEVESMLALSRLV